MLRVSGNEFDPRVSRLTFTLGLFEYAVGSDSPGPDSSRAR